MARFYTVGETALILGFSTNSIYKFLDTNRLKATRGNSKQGRFRIPHTAIEDFLGTKLSETAVATALQASRRQKTISTAPRLVTTIKPNDSSYGTSPHHLITHLEPLSQPDVTKPTTPLGLTTSRILILIVLIITIIEVATTPVINLSSQLLRLLTLLITILLAYQFGGAESR
jgi:hypothetical protein